VKILDELGVEYEVKDYIKDPPDQFELNTLSEKMGLHPKDFIRTREPIFKELNLKKYLDDKDFLIQKMSEFPKLIERPIIVCGEIALLGRPPQKIIEFLK
tara:strand:- start:286 stop:585 length:300 start_codon:yes stop_codon:yes gene_type:complete